MNLLAVFQKPAAAIFSGDHVVTGPPDVAPLASPSDIAALIKREGAYVEWRGAQLELERAEAARTAAYEAISVAEKNVKRTEYFRPGVGNCNDPEAIEALQQARRAYSAAGSAHERAGETLRAASRRLSAAASGTAQAAADAHMIHVERLQEQLAQARLAAAEVRKAAAVHGLTLRDHLLRPENDDVAAITAGVTA